MVVLRFIHGVTNFLLSLSNCVSMDPLRSRWKDRIRCIKDLFREIFVKDKGKGVRVGRDLAFRLSRGSDIYNGEEAGRWTG